MPTFVHALSRGNLFVVVVALSLLVTVGGYLLVRPFAQRLLDEESEDDRTELVGTFLQAVGTVYGLLVGLVAVGAWDDYQAAQELVSREAVTIGAFYHDASGLREPARTDLRKRTLAYVNFTIDGAWPAQRRGENPHESNARLRDLRLAIQAYVPGDAGQSNLHAEALRKLNEVVDCRRRRGELIDQELSGGMWGVVFASSFAVVALGWLMPSRSRRLHVVLQALLGLFIGLTLFMIAVHDRPLYGSKGIEPGPYELLRDRTIGGDPP